jgi:hypothetical protein
MVTGNLGTFARVMPQTGTFLPIYHPLRSRAETRRKRWPAATWALAPVKVSAAAVEKRSAATTTTTATLTSAPQAQKGGQPPTEAQPATALDSLRDAVATPAYRYWLPAGIVLGILMLLDAAYSGDWSRIGAITTEQEQQLQALVPVALGGHAACAAAAGVVSARRGEAWAPRAAKTLAGGFVSLLEVVVLPDPGPEGV